MWAASESYRYFWCRAGIQFQRSISNLHFKCLSLPLLLILLLASRVESEGVHGACSMFSLNTYSLLARTSTYIYIKSCHTFIMNNETNAGHSRH